MGSKEDSQIYRETANNYDLLITKHTIEDVKRHTRIGDTLTYRHGNGYSRDGEPLRITTARVVEIYDNFFTIENPNGTREAIKWIDLILAKSTKGGLVL